MKRHRESLQDLMIIQDSKLGRRYWVLIIFTYNNDCS